MVNKITIRNSVKIIDDEYAIKKKKNNLGNIYNYLLSRSFDYFPKVVNDDGDNYYYQYIKDISEPNEQKMIDLINLVSLLHNKTTFYKEVDIDDYKYIYESVTNLIDDTFNYYNVLIDNIDNDVYMSPSNYLVARNISIIFNALSYSKEGIDNWYKMVKDNRKIRLATVHNNLKLEHYIKGDKSYLISWDRSSNDIPLFDLITLYKNHYLEYDFINLFKIYFSKYPFSSDEMVLFLTIISIPSKIEYNSSEYKTVLLIRRIIDYIYKSNQIVLEFDKRDYGQNKV